VSSFKVSSLFFVPVAFAMIAVSAAFVGSLERSARLFKASATLLLLAASSLRAWLDTTRANEVVALVGLQAAAPLA
jgi:hypothetical protein